jgi:hypothetical protein
MDYRSTGSALQEVSESSAQGKEEVKMPLRSLVWVVLLLFCTDEKCFSHAVATCSFFPV